MRTPVARLLSPLVLVGTMVVAMGGMQSDPRAIARTPPAPVASEVVQGSSMHQAGSTGARLVAGVPDARGCRSLSVRRGTKVLLRIPSHEGRCSTNRQRIRIGRYLYFDWGVTRRRGDARQRRTDLWVSDGTRAGTVRLAVLWSGTGKGKQCAVRWERVGGISIAAARWCWKPATGAYVSGSIRIHTKGRYMRTSPVPLMQRFLVAGRRMVTTGVNRLGRELWLHDSRMTAVDIRTGPKSSAPRDFRAWGARKVRFTANDGSGRSLWVTDGTVAGTRKVR